MENTKLISYIRRVVSHEFRGPLAGIKALTFLLRRNPTPAKVTEYIQTIDQKVDTLTHHISDLLDYLKIKEGSFEINPEIVSSREQIEKIIHLHKQSITTHKIVVSKIPDVSIPADPQRFQQLLTILIDNAVKFSPDEKKVNLNIEVHSDEIHIVVQDYGVGMSDKFIANLFNDSKILDRKRTMPGMGLGLYIAQQVIKLHRGQISFTSKEKKGTTVLVKLPILK